MRALIKIDGVTLVDRIRNFEVSERFGFKDSIGVKIRSDILKKWQMND